LQAWQRPNQTVPPSADRAAIDGASGGSNSCTSIHVVFQHVENDWHSADNSAAARASCVDDRFQSQLLASCWIREFCGAIAFAPVPTERRHLGTCRYSKIVHLVVEQDAGTRATTPEPKPRLIVKVRLTALRCSSTTVRWLVSGDSLTLRKRCSVFLSTLTSLDGRALSMRIS